MKKLNLEGYGVSVKDQKGMNRFVTYEVKDILANLLAHPKLGLNGPELLEVAPLIEKIEKAGEEVILTEGEYRQIIDVFKKFGGFNKNDIQLVKRVYSCENVSNGEDNVVKLSDN